MAAVPWHQFACAEATIDHAAANLANTTQANPVLIRRALFS
jgi:hypothetical protein